MGVIQFETRKFVMLMFGFSHYNLNRTKFFVSRNIKLFRSLNKREKSKCPLQCFDSFQLQIKLFKPTIRTKRKQVEIEHSGLSIQPISVPQATLPLKLTRAQITT